MTILRSGLFVDGNFVRHLFDEEKVGGVYRIDKATPYEKPATWICGACGAEVPVGQVCRGNEATSKIGMEVHDAVEQFEQPCSRQKPVLGPLRCFCFLPLEPYLEVDGGIWGTKGCARCHRLLINSPVLARTPVVMRSVYDKLHDRKKELYEALATASLDLEAIIDKVKPVLE